ncbi:aquaporin-like protein [Truncatella angustata]|uniref:Aquaporin-like protein n=1 Tax=Truncatella angustata TaxID=152316 RepID=A0A9P8ZZU0_9PEZI|nr:aquaporin-like protein [Truncatella angustata]KAH6656374.1 aquaporin-like protein [Truncatella angustata]
MEGYQRKHDSLSSELSPISPSATSRPRELVPHISAGDSPTMPPLPPSVNDRKRSRDRNHGYADRGPQSKGTAFRSGYTTDYEGPMRIRSMQSMRSQRPNRPRHDDRDDWSEEDYYNERREYWRDRDDMRNHDRYSHRLMRENDRPPPAWRNRHFADEMDSNSTITPSKQYFEEQTPSPRQRRIQDEELGYSPGNNLEWNSLTKEQKAEVLRLPWTQWMHSNFKNHFIATLGEFIGTTLFLLFAFAGTEVANIQSQASDSDATDSNTTTGGNTGFDVTVLLYISVCFGFSLMVNVWIFFRISGGLFNPAVTFAMLLVKAVPPVRAACLFVAQICGSLLASVIVLFLFPESFNVRTTLGTGVSNIQGVFIEAILTAELVFTIFMLAKEKHRATFIAPVGIGLALFVAELVGVQFTGGSLNPARSFGPCVVTLTFDKEHWIYWVGPLIGALLAVIFYRFIKTLEYEVSRFLLQYPARS